MLFYRVFLSLGFLFMYISSAQPSATQSAPAHIHLQQLCQEYWDFLMRELPEDATAVGIETENHRWTDFSFAALEKRAQQTDELLSKVQSFDAAPLSEADRITYALLENELLERQKYYSFKSDYVAVLTPMTGFVGIPLTLKLMPFNNQHDIAIMMQRLGALVPFIDQTIELLRRAIAEHITVQKITLAKVPALLEHYLNPDIKKNPLFVPFLTLPATLNPQEQAHALANAQTLFDTHLLPALQKLHTFVTQTYIPACRDTIALADLPNGKEWYASLVKMFTNSDLIPDQVHQLGLQEIDRIRNEMQTIMDEVGFTGTLAEFYDFLHKQEQFFYPNKQVLLDSLQQRFDTINQNLATLFYTAPQLACQIQPVPEHDEQTMFGAFYVSGSVKEKRAGTFYINTRDLKALPTWEFDALCLHETNPGHHLQICRAQELEHMPEFRKHALTYAYTAFIEGWGLYAETLGQPLGLYTDAYARFGKLTYEMMRAVRLVVDTGMHARGWSRAQAIDYFMALVGAPYDPAAGEIDRYLILPGQALAYKIGQMKISQLCKYAQENLKDQFDIRMFHEIALSQGSIPLHILQAMIEQWVNQKQNPV